jgi:hypothetical protein
MYRTILLKQKKYPTLFFVIFFILYFPCSSQIKINEIFPKAQTDCPEWFEIQNTSFASINIKNWKYYIKEDTCCITASDFILEANSFVIITNNKTLFSNKYPSCNIVIQANRWHALDNYYDTLYLLDSLNNIQDSIGWNYKWFNNWNNQSLSRISFDKSGLSKEAWVLSAKPSPCQPNAEILWRKDTIYFEIGPTLFTPNQDNKDDFLSINISTPAGSSSTISIFGFNGKKYIEFKQPLSQQILWDGKDQNGNLSPIGPFFVVLEVIKDQKKQIFKRKGILWR